MPNVGPVELAIVLILALIIFGPRKLPELGRSLGSGMREFKDSITARTESTDQARQLAASPPGAGAERQAAVVTGNERDGSLN